MPTSKFSMPANLFGGNCTVTVEPVVGVSPLVNPGNCDACVTPVPHLPNGCRATWTPDENQVYWAEINDDQITPMTFDYVGFGASTPGAYSATLQRGYGPNRIYDSYAADDSGWVSDDSQLVDLYPGQYFTGLDHQIGKLFKLFAGQDSEPCSVSIQHRDGPNFATVERGDVAPIAPANVRVGIASAGDLALYPDRLVGVRTLTSQRFDVTFSFQNGRYTFFVSASDEIFLSSAIVTAGYLPGDTSTTGTITFSANLLPATKSYKVTYNAVLYSNILVFPSGRPSSVYRADSPVIDELDEPPTLSGVIGWQGVYDSSSVEDISGRVSGGANWPLTVTRKGP